MKKITVIFLIFGLLTISAYLYVNHSLNTPGFTPAQAKNPAAQSKPSESSIDLKPKLIEKLQQLVKQGSNGLYNLFIHEIKPDILKSTVCISNALLVPDTAVMNELNRSKKLPDEIFQIKADSIWIDGLGIKDILSKDVIDVKAIHILQPAIDVYSNRKYRNRDEESKTLYQRLMNQMKHIGIGKIIVEKGILTSHRQGSKQSTRFNDIAIHLSDIVIDSTTQFDRNRFMFAKEAELTMKNYSIPTSNNLYTFKVGIISANATRHVLVAKNILLQPHYSQQEFQKHIKTQLERYQISIPSIEFQTADWWNLMNNQVLQADLAEIHKADVNVYLDRRLPVDGGLRKSFPHQLIMKLPLQLNIKKVIVDDLDLTYEEFSKLSGKKSKINIDNLHGTISNFTNLPEAIKRNKMMTVTSSGIFMQFAPARLSLHFNLSDYKSGAFSASFQSEKPFDGTLVNSVSEPSGLFRVKTGQLKELVAHINGNNYKASGNVVLLYNNLHITPMKKDPQNPGELKKKSVTSLIANTFVLKDENPSKDGQVRKVNVSFTRHSGTFFNLVWKTIIMGILKTIGAPEKLAYE